MPVPLGQIWEPAEGEEIPFPGGIHGIISARLPMLISRSQGAPAGRIGDRGRRPGHCSGTCRSRAHRRRQRVAS